jgi:hypothetical protein
MCRKLKRPYRISCASLSLFCLCSVLVYACLFIYIQLPGSEVRYVVLQALKRSRK